MIKKVLTISGYSYMNESTKGFKLTNKLLLPSYMDFGYCILNSFIYKIVCVAVDDLAAYDSFVHKDPISPFVLSETKQRKER